jgi:glycosyltransferase involved in cell wall biosynthesis
LIGAADLFVMPSRAEALCQALLEAMSHGICPIVSDAGGMKEVVRHGRDGLVVPTNDVAALARAIRELHGDSQRRECYGRSALNRFRGHYTAAHLAERVLAIYDRLLGIKPSRVAA